MPSITLIFKLVNINDAYTRYVGYSYNSPLPSLFWQKSGYVVGIVYNVGDTVQTSITVPAGRHYIVFGTSSDNALGYWMDIELNVSGVRTTQRVHRSQYGYLAFDVGSDGSVTKVGDGTVAPDASPPITPSTSGSGGQSTSGGGGGEGSTGVTQTVDVGSTIKQMMDTMMPPMIQMMGMMMMMQMMVGMMTSIAGAFKG
jgi:hypothetical protein